MKASPAARLFPQETSAAAAVFLCDPSCEKGVLKSPQAFQNPKIINNLSAEYAQSSAEGILNQQAYHLALVSTTRPAMCRWFSSSPLMTIS